MLGTHVLCIHNNAPIRALYSFFFISSISALPASVFGSGQSRLVQSPSTGVGVAWAPADRQRGGTLGGCWSAPAVAVLKSAA